MHRTLSSTSALAVGAMADLAGQSRDGPVALSVLCQRQRISKSYMDQLFGKLRRGGLVRATRGPGGGYELGRDAAQISMADIVLAVDKPGGPSPRGRKGPGRREGGGQVLTQDLWNELNARLIEWLEVITLQALLDERLAHERLLAEVASSPARAAPLELATPNSVFALGRMRSPHGSWAR